MRSNRKKIAALVALGALTAIGGVSWAVSSPPSSESGGVVPDDYTQNESVRPPGEDLVGKSPIEMARTIVQRLGETAIVEVQIGGPPAGFTEGLWAYFTVDAPSESEAALRAIWEADLVTGALRDAMHSSGYVLYGARISLRLPDGRMVEDPAVGGGGNVEFNQQFPTPSRDSIEPSIREAAADVGLQVESVEVLTADQAAPAVVAKTTDPAAFVEQAGLIKQQLFGRIPLYEAYYLEVRDLDGQPVFIQATNFRIGAGHQWVRPDLDPRRPLDGGKVIPEGGSPG